MNPERIPYGRDAGQFFALWHPKSELAGFAVFIPGGFWREKYDLSHANPFCAALAAVGVIKANLEYRRVGQPGGGWPGTFEDVVAGVKAASQLVGRLPVVVGHSAGGHLALRLASDPVRLKAVIGLANGAVVEFMGGTPVAMPTATMKLALIRMLRWRPASSYMGQMTKTFRSTSRGRSCGRAETTPSRRVCSRFRMQATWI